MTNAARRVRAFRTRHPLVYQTIVCVACGALYFVLRYLFARVPAFNNVTLLSPSAGLAPVLCLFFGVPSIVGCTLGEIATWAILDSHPAVILAFSIERVIYNGLPYVLWYRVYRTREDPFPKFGTAYQLAVYLGIAVIDSLVIVGLEELRRLVVTAPGMDGTQYTVLGMNALTFLVYIGMPLLIALNRSPFLPYEPRFIRKREAEGVVYVKDPTMSMTQRMVLAAIIGALVVIVIFNVLYFMPYPFYPDYTRIMPSVFTSLYALTTIFIFVIFGPLIIMLRFLETHYTRPVEGVTKYLVTFLDRADDAAPSSVRMDVEGMRLNNEMLDLIDASEQLRSDLVERIDALASVVAEQERAATELDVARRIQMSVMPQEFAALEDAFGLDAYGFMRSAREVGGDFYDVLELGEGRVGFIIGDVSGKGVPAALFMMRALNELRYQMIACPDLGRAFTRANNALYRAASLEVFVTVFACVVDTRKGTLSYANAGHNPPWMHHPYGGEWGTCDPESVMGAFPGHTYTQHTVALQPGDGIVLYTDGVSEAARERDGEERAFYGTQRLERALRAVDGYLGRLPAAREVLEYVAADVERFADGTPQSDDMTILCFVWNPR